MCNICSDFFFFLHIFVNREERKEYTTLQNDYCQTLLYGRHTLTRFVLKQGRKPQKRSILYPSSPIPKSPTVWPLYNHPESFEVLFFLHEIPLLTWTILQQQIRPCHCHPSLQRSPKGKWVQTAVTDIMIFFHPPGTEREDYTYFWVKYLTQH